MKRINLLLLMILPFMLSTCTHEPKLNTFISEIENLSVQNGYKRIILNWDASVRTDDEKSDIFYYIKWKKGACFQEDGKIFTESTDSPTFVHHDLEDNQRYCYHIMALDRENGDGTTEKSIEGLTLQSAEEDANWVLLNDDALVTNQDNVTVVLNGVTQQMIDDANGGGEPLPPLIVLSKPITKIQISDAFTGNSPDFSNAPITDLEFRASKNLDTSAEAYGRQTICVKFYAITEEGNEEPITVGCDDIIYDPTAPTNGSVEFVEQDGVLLGSDGNYYTQDPEIPLQLFVEDEAISQEIPNWTTMKVSILADLAGGWWQNYQPNNEENTAMLIPLNLPAEDGTYRVYTKYQDAAGNETGIVSTDNSIVLDSEAPVNATIEIEDGKSITNNSDFALDLYAEGASYYQLSFEEISIPEITSLQDFQDNWQPYTTNTTLSLPSPDNGFYTVYALFADDAGNISTASDTIQFDDSYVDQAPQGSFLINGGKEATNNETVQLQIVSDKATRFQLAYCTYAIPIDADNAAACDLSTPLSTADWRNMSYLLNYTIDTPNWNNVHRLGIIFSDETTDSTAVWQDIILDNIAPTVNPINAVNTNEPELDVTFTADDNESGVDKYLLIQNDNQIPTAEDFNSCERCICGTGGLGDSCTRELEKYKILGAEGEYTFYAWAIDKAGNIADTPNSTTLRYISSVPLMNYVYVTDPPHCNPNPFTPCYTNQTDLAVRILDSDQDSFSVNENSTLTLNRWLIDEVEAVPTAGEFASCTRQNCTLYPTGGFLPEPLSVAEPERADLYNNNFDYTLTAGDGPIQLFVWLHDIAGNVGTAPQPLLGSACLGRSCLQIFYDSTEPTISDFSVDGAGSTIITEPNITLKFEAYDTGCNAYDGLNPQSNVDQPDVNWTDYTNGIFDSGTEPTGSCLRQWMIRRNNINIPAHDFSGSAQSLSFVENENYDILSVNPISNIAIENQGLTELYPYVLDQANNINDVGGADASAHPQKLEIYYDPLPPILEDNSGNNIITLDDGSASAFLLNYANDEFAVRDSTVPLKFGDENETFDYEDIDPSDAAGGSSLEYYNEYTFRYIQTEHGTSPTIGTADACDDPAGAERCTEEPVNTSPYLPPDVIIDTTDTNDLDLYFWVYDPAGLVNETPLKFHVQYDNISPVLEEFNFFGIGSPDNWDGSDDDDGDTTAEVGDGDDDYHIETNQETITFNLQASDPAPASGVSSYLVKAQAVPADCPGTAGAWTRANCIPTPPTTGDFSSTTECTGSGDSRICAGSNDPSGGIIVDFKFDSEGTYLISAWVIDQAEQINAVGDYGTVDLDDGTDESHITPYLITYDTTPPSIDIGNSTFKRNSSTVTLPYADPNGIDLTFNPVADDVVEWLIRNNTNTNTPTNLNEFSSSTTGDYISGAYGNDYDLSTLYGGGIPENGLEITSNLWVRDKAGNVSTNNLQGGVCVNNSGNPPSVTFNGVYTIGNVLPGAVLPDSTVYFINNESNLQLNIDAQRPEEGCGVSKYLVRSDFQTDPDSTPPVPADFDDDDIYTADERPKFDLASDEGLHHLIVWVLDATETVPSDASSTVYAFHDKTAPVLTSITGDNSGGITVIDMEDAGCSNCDNCIDGASDYYPTDTDTGSCPWKLCLTETDAAPSAIDCIGYGSENFSVCPAAGSIRPSGDVSGDEFAWIVDRAGNVSASGVSVGCWS